MRASLHAPRARRRSIAAATLGALALIGSVLVVTPAQALSDTGTGGVFVPATGRILDTKNNVGGYNTPMPAKTWRTVTVAGKAGVPADGTVGAVSVVATVADISAQGQLFGRPNADEPTTMMGIYGGENKQNTSFSAVLAVNSDGTIQVQAETVSRLILDVQGYYTASDDGTAPGGFVPSNGKRIVDTRSGLGAAKATVASGRSIDVQVTGTADVPAGASGVIVNLIAVNTTDSVGYLTAYATGSARPANSFNYAGGAGGVATSMQAQVQLSASGKITVYNANSTTNIVVDVQGYFTAAGQGGAVFTPGAGRAYDTRTGSRTPLAKNETRSIQVAGVAGVPVMGSGITAVVLTLTALKSTAGSGNATVWADGTTRPNTTSINFDESTIRTNTITVPLGANGKVSLSNVADATNYVLDVQGWYTNPQAPTITCPAPYTAGSWTASPSVDSVSCTVAVAAADSSNTTVYADVDGDVITGARSASGPTTMTLDVPTDAGLHALTAQTFTADGQAVTTTTTLGFGDWSAASFTPSPSSESTTSLQPVLSIASDGDLIPDGVATTFHLYASADGSGTPINADATNGVWIVPEGVLQPNTTYSWNADITGPSGGRSTASTTHSSTWTFTTNDGSAIGPDEGDVTLNEAIAAQDPDSAPQSSTSGVDLTATTTPTTGMGVSRASSKEVHCVGVGNKKEPGAPFAGIHGSVGRPDHQAVIKAYFQCTGHGISEVDVHFKGLLSFAPAKSDVTVVKMKDFKTRGTADYHQTAKVNGKTVVFYLPPEDKGGGGYGKGRWLATGNWQASGGGLVSDWQSSTKSMFADIKKP